MKKFRKPLIILSIAIAAMLPLAFTGDNNYFEISKNLDIFATLYREVNTYYVDEVDPSKFMRTGIDAMLESLDPYHEGPLDGRPDSVVCGRNVGLGAHRPVAAL